MRWTGILLLGLFLSDDAYAAKRKKAPPPPPPPRAAPARTPSPDAQQAPCPLSGLPEASVLWSPQGYLWLMEDGDVLLAVDLGRAVAAQGVYGTCANTTIELAEITGGTALNIQKISVDVADIVRHEAPWRTPDAKARRRAERAVRAGDLPGARQALTGLNRAEPETVDAWVEIAYAAVAEGDLRGAADDISGLPLQQDGVREALVAVARAAVPAAASALDRGELAHAQHLFTPASTALAAGIGEDRWPALSQREARVVQGRIQLASGDAKGAAQTLDAVVAADPKMGRAWLALAEARWQAKDKKGARAAYAQAAGELATSTWPPTLAERCPKCTRPSP